MDALFATAAYARAVILIQVFRPVSNRKSFPNALSAWWILVLLGLGWVPPLAIEIIDRFWPDPANPYRRTSFGEPWMFAITLPFTGLAIAALVVQLVWVVRMVVRGRRSVQ